MADTPSKVALITGSSTGFGRGLCTSLLERGWTVFASMRRCHERRPAFAADAQRHGRRLRLLELDVTDAAQREAAARAIEAGGRLDCLVNNAGFGQFGPVEEVTEEAWRRQMEVNFFGPVLLTRRLLPALRQARGRVVNISSIVGLAGIPLAAPYAASKWSLEGFSEALYYELRPHGVQVAVVEPGGYHTRFSDNVAFAVPPKGSPYEGQAEAYLGLRRRRAKEQAEGKPADKVVRALVKLIEARRMPLRTLVGGEARLLDGVGRLLPRNLAVSLLARVYAAMMPVDRRGGRQ